MTNNIGSGLVVGDLSLLNLDGASTIVGNGQPDIACPGRYSVKKGSTNTGPGSTTAANCAP